MIGVVLAGGASTRFGGKPKGLQLLGKRPLALHVASMFTSFTAPILIEAVPGAGYETLTWPLIHARPEHAGKGPLAGIAAGLALMDEREALAHSDPRVAFAPCDMPKLNGRVYRDLAAANERGAYARTAQGDEPLVAVLSPGMRAVLIEALSHDRIPRTVEVLQAAGARAVEFAESEFFVNVNTPDDLTRLNAALPIDVDPSKEYFAFTSRVERFLMSLDSDSRAAWSRRLARILLPVLAPKMPAPLREIFREAMAYSTDAQRDDAVRKLDTQSAQGPKTVKHWYQSLDADIVAMLALVLEQHAPLDGYEVHELLISLVQNGVSEADVMHALVRENPGLAQTT